MLPVDELALDASFSVTESASTQAPVWPDTEDAPRRGAESLEGVL